jgi:hypothetical protein
MRASCVAAALQAPFFSHLRVTCIVF